MNSRLVILTLIVPSRDITQNGTQEDPNMKLASRSLFGKQILQYFPQTLASPLLPETEQPESFLKKQFRKDNYTENTIFFCCSSSILIW